MELELWRKVAFSWEKHLGATKLLEPNSPSWGHARGNRGAARMGKVGQEWAGDACAPTLSMPMANAWNWVTFKVPSNRTAMILSLFALIKGFVTFLFKVLTFPMRYTIAFQNNQQYQHLY